MAILLKRDHYRFGEARDRLRRPYEHGGAVHWGVLRNGSITPVSGEYPSTGDFLRENSMTSLDSLRAPAVDVGAVSILSPVTRDQQFVCQGANYRQHMIESGLDHARLKT